MQEQAHELSGDQTRACSAARASPTPRCSWLRSSTAPSESTPASISGASASTAAARRALHHLQHLLHARWRRPHARDASASVDAYATAGRHALTEGGHGPRAAEEAAPVHMASPPHRRARGKHRACRARQALREAESASPMPLLAAIRFAAARAAMPTSAHGPHCTLVAAVPRACRQAASASRHAVGGGVVGLASAAQQRRHRREEPHA